MCLHEMKPARSKANAQVGVVEQISQATRKGDGVARAQQEQRAEGEDAKPGRQSHRPDLDRWSSKPNRNGEAD